MIEISNTQNTVVANQHVHVLHIVAITLSAVDCCRLTPTCVTAFYNLHINNVYCNFAVMLPAICCSFDIGLNRIPTSSEVFFKFIKMFLRELSIKNIFHDPKRARLTVYSDVSHASVEWPREDLSNNSRHIYESLRSIFKDRARLLSFNDKKTGANNFKRNRNSTLIIYTWPEATEVIPLIKLLCEETRVKFNDYDHISYPVGTFLHI